jgi:hypothetical protein
MFCWITEKFFRFIDNMCKFITDSYTIQTKVNMYYNINQLARKKIEKRRLKMSYQSILDNQLNRYDDIV